MTALTALFHRSAPAAARSPGVALSTAFAMVRIWHERAMQRRELANLSPELLRDMGLSQANAQLEASKPFWVE